MGPAFFHSGHTRFRANGIQDAEPNSAFPGDVTKRGKESKWGTNVRVGDLGHCIDCLSLGVAHHAAPCLALATDIGWHLRNEEAFFGNRANNNGQNRSNGDRAWGGATRLRSLTKAGSRIVSGFGAGLATFARRILGRVGAHTRPSKPVPNDGARRGLDLINDLTLGWQLNACHSVAVSVNIAYNRLRATGLEHVAPFSLYPNDVTNKGTEYEWGTSIRVGYLGHLTRCLSIGIAYQTRTWTKNFSRYRGLVPNAGDFETPSNVWLGAAYDVTPCLVIASDLGWYFWKHTDLFGNKPNGNPNGAANGPGLGWRDQLVFRIGAAHEFWRCWTARIGYNYGQFVIPSADLAAANLVTRPLVRHHITAGLSYVWGCNEFSIAYIHGFRETLMGTFSPKLSAEQDQVSVSWGRVF